MPAWVTPVDVSEDVHASDSCWNVAGRLSQAMILRLRLNEDQQDLREQRRSGVITHPKDGLGLLKGQNSLLTRLI